MSFIKRSDNTNAVIIRGISFALVFVAIVAVVIGGIVYYYREGDFITTLKTRFVVGAFSVLFASSIIYTPFSYGVSYYFLRSKTDDAKLADIFYLFRLPRLLLRAIVCDTLRRLVITLIRLMILLAAAAVEMIFLTYCDPDPALSIILHIIAWSAVLFLLFVAKIRFILCKYVLISCPDSGVITVFRKGLLAIRGHTPAVIRFYIKYLAVYIFTFLTLGLSRARRLNKNRDSFCTFAVRLVNNY